MSSFILSKITDKQKKEFYKLYKQGFRARYISKAVGINKRHAERIIYSFDSGDFSWLESRFRHYTKAAPEVEKLRIVQEMISTNPSWAEAVSQYDFPESVLVQWKKNYTEHGVCSRKRGRPRKDGSND